MFIVTFDRGVSELPGAGRGSKEAPLMVVEERRPWQGTEDRTVSGEGE